MKNLTFLVLAMLMANAVFAQKGVVIMLDFTPGVSMALNKQDFDRGRDLDLDAAFGFEVGLKVGYSFNDKLSLVTGIGFFSHKASFVHERDYFTPVLLGQPGIADRNHKKTFSRELGYVRIPLMLQIGGSGGEDKGGFFFRFGPTFNFLTGATYKDERFIGSLGYDHAVGINVNKMTDLYTSTDAGATKNKTIDASSPTGFKQGAIYESFVFGVALDIGGQIRLAENFKMIITLHLETSLTNPEGAGAGSYAHNIYLDAGIPTTNSPVYDATFPNYTDDLYDEISTRASTFNVFGGLTIGFSYTIPTEK